MRRVVIAHADAVRDRCQASGSRVQAVLVTLTYRPGCPWQQGDIAAYCKRARDWLRRRGIAARYEWVIELQQRGAPHYHVMFWLPHGVKLPKPDVAGWWTQGMSNIKAATRPVGYLVKYATKGESGELPKGARLFGVGSPDGDHKLLAHRKGLPSWLDAVASPGTRCVRVTRVGWVERDTGEVHRSPFALSWERDEFGIPTVRIVGRQSHA